MSRIGRKPVEIPSGVTVTVDQGQVVVKGSKGELKFELPAKISVEVKDGQVEVSRKGDSRPARAAHGLVRSLISNNIVGVSEGYKKTLKMVGTGYRATAKGAGIELAVGLSHKVEVKPMDGVKLSLEGQDTIHVEGIDKQAVGLQAAKIRDIRPPEVYKGKGIRYVDEVVRLKPGKTAA
jgi:large subunit ribosomal protein L6